MSALTWDCAFVRSTETAATDTRVMHEQILTTLIRSDEAVALRIVEPLDGPGCHKTTSFALNERVKEAPGTTTTRSLPVLACQR